MSVADMLFCMFVCIYCEVTWCIALEKITLKQWIKPSAVIIRSDYFVTGMASTATLRVGALLYKY